PGDHDGDAMLVEGIGSVVPPVAGGAVIGEVVGLRPDGLLAGQTTPDMAAGHRTPLKGGVSCLSGLPLRPQARQPPCPSRIVHRTCPLMSGYVRHVRLTRHYLAKYR